MTTDVVADSVTGSPAGSAMSRRERGMRNSPSPASGAVYGLGLIGAFVYFVSSANSGMDVVLAAGKAIVWPALLVYLAFKRLGA